MQISLLSRSRTVSHRCVLSQVAEYDILSGRGAVNLVDRLEGDKAVAIPAAAFDLSYTVGTTKQVGRKSAVSLRKYLLLAIHSGEY